MYRYPRGVFPNCRVYGRSNGYLTAVVRADIPPVKAECYNNCDNTGIVTILSDGSRAWAVSPVLRISYTLIDKLFHSRDVEELAEEIEEPRFARALFIQDVSGSMVESDNAGVYEILLANGVSVGFFGNESFLDWFSFYGQAGQTEINPGLIPTNTEITDSETGDRIPAIQWFEENAKGSYLIGASIDESDGYGNDINIITAENTFINAQARLKPLLFNETLYSGQLVEPRAIIARSELFTSKTDIIDYQRESPATEKANAFLKLYRKYGV